MADDEDPCLHCILMTLLDDWIEEERDPPNIVILRTAEALGNLLALILPADRERALADIMTLMRETAAAASADRESASRLH